MRGLLCLALCSLLVSGGIAHDVEDDFDDEAEVEEEAEGMDTVTVEKVKIVQKFLKFTEQLNFMKNRLNNLINQVTIDVPYLTPSDNVDFYFMDALDSSDSLGTKWTR